MIEEKLDNLTKEMVLLRKAVEANTAAGGGTAPAAVADKPKAGRPAKAKPEAVEPNHDAAEVEEKVREVSKSIGRPAAVKLIKSFKCDDLADLLTHPEHFDAAYDAAVEALGETDDETSEDEDI